MDEVPIYETPQPIVPSRRPMWLIIAIIIVIAVLVGAYFFRDQLLGGSESDDTQSALSDEDLSGFNLPAFEHLAIDGEIVSITVQSLTATEQAGVVEFTFDESINRDGATYVFEKTATGRVFDLFTKVVEAGSETPWDPSLLERIDPKSSVTLLTYQKDLDGEVIIYRIILSAPLR